MMGVAIDRDMINIKSMQFCKHAQEWRNKSMLQKIKKTLQEKQNSFHREKYLLTQYFILSESLENEKNKNKRLIGRLQAAVLFNKNLMALSECWLSFCSSMNKNNKHDTGILEQTQSLNNNME